MTARSKALRAALAAALAAALVLPGAAVLGQGTTISFLTPYFGAPPDQALLDAFQAETGITVDIQSVEETDLYSRVQVAAGSGTPAADVIFLSSEAPSYIVARKLETGTPYSCPSIVQKSVFVKSEKSTSAIRSLSGIMLP
ncbi:MAG: extracellular solute-binding protein, partial [Chloroflexota bacterium]